MYRFKEADKSRFINNNKNLTATQKKEILDALNNPKTSYLERNIDWNKAINATYDYFKVNIFDKMKVESLGGVVLGKDAVKAFSATILIGNNTVDLDFYAVKTYDGSVALASNKTEPKTWGKLPSWYSYSKPQDDYEVSDAYPNLYGGAKWCISMRHTSKFWKDYTNENIYFLFALGKKGSNDKYALVLNINPIDIELDDVFNKDDESMREQSRYSTSYINTLNGFKNIVHENKETIYTAFGKKHKAVLDISEINWMGDTYNSDLGQAFAISDYYKEIAQDYKDFGVLGSEEERVIDALNAIRKLSHDVGALNNYDKSIPFDISDMDDCTSVPLTAIVSSTDPVLHRSNFKSINETYSDKIKGFIKMSKYNIEDSLACVEDLSDMNEIISFLEMLIYANTNPILDDSLYQEELDEELNNRIRQDLPRGYTLEDYVEFLSETDYYPEYYGDGFFDLNMDGFLDWVNEREGNE